MVVLGERVMLCGRKWAEKFREQPGVVVGVGYGAREDGIMLRLEDGRLIYAVEGEWRKT